MSPCFSQDALVRLPMAAQSRLSHPSRTLNRKKTREEKSKSLHCWGFSAVTRINGLEADRARMAVNGVMEREGGASQAVEGINGEDH